ncbi:MAG: FkbM family methyltransferase [Pyrinomonadaceae bacterium]
MSLANKIRGFKEVWAFDNRLWLAFTKTFFRAENLHIYRFKGVEILVDHAGGDSNGAREVLTSPMYRRFLPKMKLDAPINVLDLGANNGGFPLLLHTSGIKLKKVVSVEFNPNTFTRLHFNLTRNLPGDIIPVNAALCGEKRTIEIALGNGGVSDSIYDDVSNGESRLCVIEGLTLDDLCSTYFENEVIDICKIDVEEAEFEVFLQPHHERLTQCRYVIMEIHERGGRRAEEILPVLDNLGFVLQTQEADADPTVYFFINSKLL